MTNTGDPDGTWTFDGITILTLAPGQVRNDIDFGYRGQQLPRPVLVYRDYSVNGLREPAAANPETGIAGVTVTLTGEPMTIGHRVFTRTTVDRARTGRTSSPGCRRAATLPSSRRSRPRCSRPGCPGSTTAWTLRVRHGQGGSSPAKNKLAVALFTADVAGIGNTTSARIRRPIRSASSTWTSTTTVIAAPVSRALPA